MFRTSGGFDGLWLHYDFFKDLTIPSIVKPGAESTTTHTNSFVMLPASPVGGSQLPSGFIHSPSTDMGATQSRLALLPVVTSSPWPRHQFAYPRNPIHCLQKPLLLASSIRPALPSSETKTNVGESTGLQENYSGHACDVGCDSKLHERWCAIFSLHLRLAKRCLDT